MSTSIRVELSHEKDSGAIVELQKFTWLCTYPNEKEQITKEEIKEHVDTFKEDYWKDVNKNDRTRCWVAKEGDGVVGFCVARKYPKLNQLSALYIHPNYQKRGIGKLLTETALSWLGKDKKVQARVVAYNTAAINFYRKMGFVKKGRPFKGPVTLSSGRPLSLVRMILI